MLNKFWKWLLLILLMTLPFQTRWIYDAAFLNGHFWEYGTSSWYATEILLWVVIILFSTDKFFGKDLSHIFSKWHYVSHRRSLILAVLFVLFLLSSAVFSSNFSISYNYVFRVLEAICLFLILTSVGSERTKLLFAFWGGGVVQAVLGSYQFFSQEVVANKWLGIAGHLPEIGGTSVIESVTERWLRAYGSFGSPNILGGYLALCLMVGLFLYFQSKPFSKIIYTFGQVVILIGLFFTFSRSALLAALAGFISFGLVCIFSEQRIKYFFNYSKQALFYVLIILTLSLAFGDLYSSRLEGSSRLEELSISERISGNEEAIMYAREKPNGVGPGAYTYYSFLKKNDLAGYSYQPVHNSYLLLVVEWGVGGALLWFFIFAFLSKKIWEQNRFFVPILVTLFIAAAFDHFWWSLYQGLIPWWAMFGLLLA